MISLNTVEKHYDILIDEGQDPVHDPEPLQRYMDKWDGQRFIDSLKLNKNKSVLEIGVGTGRLAVKVAPFCKSFTGIDISAKTVKKARENIKTAQIICGDFFDVVFDEKFDVIYSSLTFLHIKDKQATFDKIYRLLNIDARFVLSIDKSQEKVLDVGSSKIKVYPDNPADIRNYAENTGLFLEDAFETDFAHIFVFIKKS